MFSKEQMSEQYKEIYGEEVNFDTVEEKKGFTIASKKGMTNGYGIRNSSIYYIVNNDGKQPEGAVIYLDSSKEHEVETPNYDFVSPAQTVIFIKSGKEKLAYISGSFAIDTADSEQIGGFFAKVSDKSSSDFRVAKKFYTKFIGNQEYINIAKKQIIKAEIAEQNRKKRVEKFTKLRGKVKEKWEKQEKKQKEEKRKLQKQTKHDRINSFVSDSTFKNKVLDKIKRIFE